MFSQACVKNSVHRGMHGRVACVARVGGGVKTAIAVDGTHPTGMHSCLE